jgi:hypothetical protein
MNRFDTNSRANQGGEARLLILKPYALQSYLVREEGVPGGIGAISPVIFFLMLLIDGSIRPGYSPIAQVNSDLGLGWSLCWISALTSPSSE